MLDGVIIAQGGSFWDYESVNFTVGARNHVNSLTTTHLPDDVELPEVNDSKKISDKKRARLYDDINVAALAVGVGVVPAEEIDDKNVSRQPLKPCTSQLVNYL